MQRIVPYLLYEDVEAALAWLAEAFGFEEVLRHVNDAGEVWHAEMSYGGESVYLGDPGADYRGPRRADHSTALVHVLVVGSLDEHYERARATGAEIRLEPTEQPYGDRRYDCYDLEGHLWSFAERIRDVAPEEWGARTPDRRV